MKFPGVAAGHIAVDRYLNALTEMVDWSANIYDEDIRLLTEKKDGLPAAQQNVPRRAEAGSVVSTPLASSEHDKVAALLCSLQTERDPTRGHSPGTKSIDVGRHVLIERPNLKGVPLSTGDKREAADKTRSLVGGGTEPGKAPNERGSANVTRPDLLSRVRVRHAPVAPIGERILTCCVGPE